MMSCPVVGLPTELIEEIVQYLIKELDEDEFYNSDSRRNLFPCALSCSAFFRPAIRALWHTVELLPLLKLLPGFEVVDGSYVINGELDDVSLARFDLYSFMVKKLLVFETHPVHHSVYSSLAVARPLPLPSLTSVYCHAKLFSLDETMFMLSPSVESVLFFSCNDQVLIDYLSALSVLQEEAPMLRSLSIYGVSGKDFDIATVSQLEDLRELELNLYNLRIKEMQGPFYPLELKRLGLNGAVYSVQSALMVLDVYEYSEIETFSLTGSVLPAEAGQEIFSAIFSQWSGSMTSLELDICIMVLDEVVEPDAEDPLSDFLSPLYSLENLEVFDLRYRGDNDSFTDILISDICEAWPNLTKLKMDSHGFENAPTVTSLKVLAERCPKLKQVSIPLDITNAPAINHDTHTNKSLPSSHTLESITFLVEGEISLQYLLANGSASLPYHLDVAFPFLKEVYIQSSIWDKVMGVIKLFQDARRTQAAVTVSA
ncbi:hypothetical protein D9758_014888 [Tetrapyrgos nigripes]|uniref:Uncharacterized protein n=1 Tax=Tetrapyrgos nigripes TaxID=182062 RepID=A0A8H5CDH7_9AGAR|nr:hypothetical protein D9758_014888 [Tetrapyrgos nigripes]